MAGRHCWGGEEAVAGKGDESADVVHDEIEAGGQDGGDVCTVEASEGAGGRVECRWPHCHRDIGALLQSIGEDGDGWGQWVGGGGVGFGVRFVWTYGCYLSAMVSATLVISGYETVGAIDVPGKVTLGGVRGEGRAVVGGAAGLGACATGV